MSDGPSELGGPPLEAASEKLLSAVSQQGARGGVFAATGWGARMAMTLAAGIILRKLIGPEDFGIVAYAAVILDFLSRLRTWGFDEALLRRQDQQEAVASAHFVWQVRLAAVVAALALVVALLGRHFGARLAPMHVLVALAAMDIVRVTGSTPRVLLEKGLRFERLSAIEVSASFVSYAAAIFTAWRWPEQGIWALVGQRGVEILLRVIGFWAVHPVKISRAVDPAVTRWMFLSFGWPLWIGSAFFVVTFQSPEFLVGRLLGLEALGLYSTALRLATLPRDLVSFVPRVVSPIYSHLQRDRAALAAVFEKVQGTLIRVVVLVIVPLAVLVPDLLELFGLLEKWQGVVPVFRALCVYALSYAAFVNVPSLATVGLGMPKLHFKVQVLQGATVVALCPLLTWLYGALGTAVAMDAMMLSSTAVLWWLVSRQMPVRLGRIFVPPLLAGAIAAAAGLLVCWLLLSLPLWIRLPVELCSILAAYFALLFALEGALLWRRVIEFRNLLLRQA